MASCGVNGFGRFGLHLLKYWLDREHNSPFQIDFINDDILTLDDAVEIINNDLDLDFSRYKVRASDGELLISGPLGYRKAIPFTNSEHAKPEAIPWVGRPQMVFECSGKLAEFPRDCERYLQDNTDRVLISATSYDADATLVYGFNHQSFDSEAHRIISYGSCTINAYVPLAVFINQAWEIADSDVHVTHNIPGYKLQGRKNQILFRKGCTLEKMAPILLGFLNENNFLVDYIVGPFTNVSAITFRFGLKQTADRGAVLDRLEKEIASGSLKGLYEIDEVDPGNSNRYKGTTASAVFPKDGIKMVGNNLYLQAYFDNENSTNRFYDLVCFIAEKQKH